MGVTSKLPPEIHAIVGNIGNVLEIGIRQIGSVIFCVQATELSLVKVVIKCEV